MSLFERKPLAERVRPARVEDMAGVSHLARQPGPVRAWLTQKKPTSMILWGPPGCGKTTLARILLAHFAGPVHNLSATLGSGKEAKELLAEAAARYATGGDATALFVDEVHRFNKGQQDLFLPHLERGDVVLVGATTENPSFHLNDALLSRAPVVMLHPLTADELAEVLQRVLRDDPELAALHVTDDALAAIARRAGGDARAALGLLEAASAEGMTELDAAAVEGLLVARAPRHDRDGEAHHSLLSALHKSVRNSDAQATLYWLGRLLDGGEAPLVIARRLVRMASEDVGLADPNALHQALAAKDTVDFIGMPEADLALAQAAVYLALAPKSNSLYEAMGKVREDLEQGVREEVPLHLRNAATKRMAAWGWGKGYRYAHDEPTLRADMECLPEALHGRAYYAPRDSGFEKRLREWMETWARRRADAAKHPS